MRALDLTLRALGQGNLNAAIDLRARMNQEMNGSDPDSEYPGWRLRFENFFASRIGAGSAAMYIAEMGGAAVGLACVYVLSNHRTEIFLRPVAYITSVYVVPEKRRQGLATALTQACIDWAVARGIDIVRLRASEMGRPLYAGMGFTPSNELEMLPKRTS